MDVVRIASTVMAALELLPAEPSDLTAILSDDDESEALLAQDAQRARLPLTAYLCERLDPDRIDYWHEELDRATRSDKIAILVAGQPDYPRELGGYWNPPPILFVKGRLPTTTSLAIVGSRNADPETLDRTRQVAAEIARRGIVVTSGLAKGVDTAAHLGALDAAGITVAVLGSGLHQIYPRENIGLARRIAVDGAVLSQFAPDVPPTSTSFLRRNAVIAGLTTASLVMDAKARSGSRHELEQAVSFGKRAFLWEPTLGDHSWAQALAHAGQATFVSSVSDLISGIGEQAEDD